MIEFAPLNIPLRRRLQTTAVLQWVFSFLALAQFCLAAFVLLSLSDWWMVALLYAGWLWLDGDTPSSGGRRSQWVRCWGVWEYFREYFPITLVKTVDLDSKKNYIFGFHPHGVLVAGAFGNFCTEATGFSRLFPGLKSHLLMLPFWFRVPLFRDYIMCGGHLSVCLHLPSTCTHMFVCMHACVTSVIRPREIMNHVDFTSDLRMFA